LSRHRARDLINLAAIAAAAVAVGGVMRGRAAREAERAFAARFPRGVDGVVSGAEGFRLHGTNGRALLLLHGLGDTPQSLRYLGDRLHAAGYTVHAPLLPGHGRGLREFADASAARYLEAVRRELDWLESASDWVGLVGLSMGGALATRLAAASPRVRVLVLLAPYLEAPPLVQWLARTAPLWGLLVPYLAGRGETSVHDPVARSASRAYGVFTPRAVRALVATAAAARHSLAAVTAPTLMVHSREDNRIPSELAERASGTLRAPTERHWVAGCGHVITVDFCRDAVASRVLDFLARHTG
jgi:carboxylesterase